MRGVKMLTFPDGSKVGVIGLYEAMEDLYNEGQPADFDSGDKLIKRLDGKNYFPPSDINIYRMLLQSEYKVFLEDRDAARKTNS